MVSGITRGDVAAITIRILGIYIMLEGISPLLITVSRSSFSPYRLPASAVLPFVIVLAVFESLGLFMVLKASLIARWLLPKAPIVPAIAPAPGSPIELQSAAFAVVGVLLVVWAIPEIAVAVWRYTYESIQSTSHEQSGFQLTGLLCKPVLEFLLGLWLFFGSKRLSWYWQKTRAHRPSLDSDSSPL